MRDNRAADNFIGGKIRTCSRNSYGDNASDNLREESATILKGREDQLSNVTCRFIEQSYKQVSLYKTRVILKNNSILLNYR